VVAFGGDVPKLQIRPIIETSFRQRPPKKPPEPAGWSTTRIGRFYNGRHGTTALQAVAKIKRVRETDETLDTLIDVMAAALNPTMEGRHTQRFERGRSTALIHEVAARVLEQISASTAG
jgi:hypothetical protein